VALILPVLSGCGGGGGSSDSDGGGNPPPSVTVYNIDFCRLQFPGAIDDAENTAQSVFGRVFIAGLTDVSGVNDPAAEVIGAVGYGPDGSNPSVSASWVWSDAAPNAGYNAGSPGYEANNDEYVATLTVPGPPGNYDFAFRFSGDSGATFTYCDSGNGSADGYAPADAGQLIARQAALYFSEYLEGSSNNKALEIFNPSAASVDISLCSINTYANGASTASFSVPLTGSPLGTSLPAGQAMVVCNSGILVLANCNLATASPALSFNGDDAVELRCNGTTLDVIGQIGVDPGTEWFDGIGTQDETLRRLCAVTAGDTNGADVFLPSAEWEGSFIDDFSDLGQHNCP